MEKRIELERRTRKANQVTELNLDNCRSTNIVGLTDEYTALESLSLINVGLTTLKGFPKLPSLKKLELSDNRISNGLNYLTTSPKLQSLNLSGNKIKDLITLQPLQEFKNLEVLDLFNNEVQNVEFYREKIFEMLPSLKFLDGFDCNDHEAPSGSDDDEEVNGNDSEDDEVVESMGEDEDTDESDEDFEEVEEGDSEDNNDVSLAEVYNEDLEEDNSEWDEQDGVEDAEDDDDDDDDDEDEDADDAADGEPKPKSGKSKEGKRVETNNDAAGGAPEATNAKKSSSAKADEAEAAEDKDDASAGEDEPQARGKKRKHEG